MTWLFFIGTPAILFVVGLVFARYALNHERCRTCPYYSIRCLPVMLLDPLKRCPRASALAEQPVRTTPGVLDHHT
jgi:hypothetical protein